MDHQSNIITKLLIDVGSDAFSMGMIIASYLNESKEVPEFDQLRKLCPVHSAGELKAMPRQRAYNALEILEYKGLLMRWQEKSEKGFGNMQYRISDLFLSSLNK